jgi:CheY-like chemotaxis protein
LRQVRATLTGYALPGDLQRAAEAGFQRHVPKPPVLEKLGQLLAEVRPSAPTLS